MRPALRSGISWMRFTTRHACTPLLDIARRQSLKPTTTNAYPVASAASRLSFKRHEEIYQSDDALRKQGRDPASPSLAHRLDESPVGYSSAGCAPAEPAFASPTETSLQPSISLGNDFPANGSLSPISPSHLRGAVQS